MLYLSDIRAKLRWKKLTPINTMLETLIQCQIKRERTHNEFIHKQKNGRLRNGDATYNGGIAAYMHVQQDRVMTSEWSALRMVSRRNLVFHRGLVQFNSFSGALFERNLRRLLKDNLWVQCQGDLFYLQWMLCLVAWGEKIQNDLNVLWHEQIVYKIHEFYDQSIRIYTSVLMFFAVFCT